SDGAEPLPPAMLDLDVCRLRADGSEDDLDLGPLGWVPAKVPGIDASSWRLPALDPTPIELVTFRRLLEDAAASSALHHDPKVGPAGLGMARRGPTDDVTCVTL